MADIDRMFRSELAILADQHSHTDLWALDPPFDASTPFDDGGPSNWDTSLDRPTSEHLHYPDATLGLFPPPDRRLGGPTPADHFAARPQPTVHLSDVSLGTATHLPVIMPVPVSPIQIPLTSSGAPITLSPTDSIFQTELSSEDMDSDDFNLVYPSDSEYIPSPVSIDPASLSVPGTSPLMVPNADILAHAAVIRPSRRAARAMTKVPVPVPNLTKKSRGRKVPTSNGDPIYAASKDKTKKGVRTYTCHAQGCGKCFVRGEHLKRHIRSIHTEEKPWECTYAGCNRTFSRRDNLNQHLRIHKLQNDGDD